MITVNQVSDTFFLLVSMINPNRKYGYSLVTDEFYIMVDHYQFVFIELHENQLTDLLRAYVVK